MPLMKAGRHALPEDHEACESDPCIGCKARANLQPGDWTVVQFYQFVSDQVVNPAPFGLEGGRTWLPLRLSELVVACDLLGVPPDQRVELVSDVRYLHDMITERVKHPGLHRMPVALLEPPED